jgi:MFS family permease
MHWTTNTKKDYASSPMEPVQSKSDRPPFSLPHEVAFVLTVCMAQLMTQAGLGQAIAPLHIIGASFGVDDDPAQLAWFPAAYSLTVGTFILIAGRLGDLYGHKRLFVAGFLWFGLWSVIAGFAVYSGPILFDCCRAFQGIGPAFLLPNGIAILGTTYEPGVRKAMVFSAFGAMAPSGFVVGALF